MILKLLTTRLQAVQLNQYPLYDMETDNNKVRQFS